MRKTRHFATIAVLSILLTGCEFNFESLKNLFKKAAKQTMDLIVVGESKKQSLRDETKTLYGADFVLESTKPYEESATSVLDISAVTQDRYLDAFKDAMNVYEQNNGAANITQKGYYSTEDKLVKYQKAEDTYVIQKSGDSYTATKNDVEVDMSDASIKSAIEKSYKLWADQWSYCFSYELNALINLRARLAGSTADETSSIDFLSKVMLKDYRDAGNYTAFYYGEAHKNEGANDVAIDYVEAKYVDYRMQYCLLHSVSVNLDSLIETHKLTYTKFVYNVDLADCF